MLVCHISSEGELDPVCIIWYTSVEGSTVIVTQTYFGIAQGNSNIIFKVSGVSRMLGYSGTSGAEPDPPSTLSLVWPKGC